MLNILEFTYLISDHIERAAQVLQLGPSALKQLSERYVLLSASNIITRHNVTIHEILYEDLRKNKYASDYYDNLVKQYGDHILDYIFPKDDKNMKRKIINTIYFALDKVYKCDKLLITFEESKESIDNIIYHVLQEEFEVLSQETLYNTYYMIIKRRNKEND